MPRSSAGPGTVGTLPPLAPRIGLAALAARVIAAVVRRLGRGGTALPGLVAETLAPAFVPTVARQLPRGVVLLTGTNGKTTTARMLAAILAHDGVRFVHNARRVQPLARPGVRTCPAHRLAAGGCGLPRRRSACSSWTRPRSCAQRRRCVPARPRS